MHLHEQTITRNKGPRMTSNTPPEPGADIPEPMREEIEHSLFWAELEHNARQYGALRRAYRRLADRYPDECDELFQDELKRLKERDDEP